MSPVEAKPFGSFARVGLVCALLGAAACALASTPGNLDPPCDIDTKVTAPLKTGSMAAVTRTSPITGIYETENSTMVSVELDANLILMDGFESPLVPVPPFRFAFDTDWVSPSRNGKVVIHDSLDRAPPPSLFEFQVVELSCCGHPIAVDVDPEGNVSLTGEVNNYTHSFAIRANSNLGDVPSVQMIVAVNEDADLTVAATEHWRLVIPNAWKMRADSAVPDWLDAMDVGWEAQKEIMGKTGEEAVLAEQPDQALLPFASATENPTVCGISTVPLNFGEDCFLFPFGAPMDEPRWFIIFHELGHGTTISQLSRAIYCHLFCGALTWVEGDASVLSMWSSRRMSEDLSLSEAARTSVSETLQDDMNLFASQLATWEQSNEPFADNNDPNSFHAGSWDGIHVTLINEFGWDYLLRYARAWRADPIVVGLMSAINTDTRATFAAAAVSAALEQRELRERFEDEWRFPIQDPLFDQLYDHLVDAMDAPWD